MHAMDSVPKLVQFLKYFVDWLSKLGVAAGNRSCTAMTYDYRHHSRTLLCSTGSLMRSPESCPYLMTASSVTSCNTQQTTQK